MNGDPPVWAWWILAVPFAALVVVAVVVNVRDRGRTLRAMGELARRRP